MIEFKQLSILLNGTKLIIEVTVKDIEYYKDVYIDLILIDTQDTFIESGPSSTPVYSNTVEGDLKVVRLEIPSNEILATLTDNMFFVYVKTKGTPASDTPCGMDSETTLGVTVYFYSIYQLAMNYIREVNDSCDIPKEFINFILLYKALLLSVATGNYRLSIYFWKLLNKNKDKIANIINCKCYG